MKRKIFDSLVVRFIQPDTDIKRRGQGGRKGGREGGKDEGVGDLRRRKGWERRERHLQGRQ